MQHALSRTQWSPITVDYRSNLHRLTGLVLLAEGKPRDALDNLKRSDGSSNPFTTLGMIEAHRALGNAREAERLRAELLARKDIALNAVSAAVAHHRAARRR